MRLVNIGAGEIADRLTILALKVAHGQQAGKDVSHFLTERNALLVQSRTYEQFAGPGLEHLLDLAAVNAMLWQAEDEIRCLRALGLDALLKQGFEPDLVRALQCAFRVQALNDQRADLVWTLNKLAGTDLGREKLND